MKWLVDWIKILPTSLQIAIVCIVVGIGVAYAHEVRYMTIADYNKGYVLELKKQIRELEYDLDNMEMSDRERHDAEMDLEELIDMLCLELPNDRKCNDYEEDA